MGFPLLNDFVDFSPSPQKQVGAFRGQVGRLLMAQHLVSFTSEGSKLVGQFLGGEPAATDRALVSHITSSQA